MRCRIDSVTTFGGSSKYGLGVTIHYGTIGTTYGEAGKNMFLSLTFWLFKGFTIHFTWKGRSTL